MWCHCLIVLMLQQQAVLMLLLEGLGCIFQRKLLTSRTACSPLKEFCGNSIVVFKWLANLLPVSLEEEKREFSDVLQQRCSEVATAERQGCGGAGVCLKAVQWYKVVTNTLVLS